MPAPAQKPSLTPITVFLRSQMRLLSVDAVDEFLLRYHPIVYTHRESAINKAREAAPREESPDERLVYLARALGGIPGIGVASDYPPHVSYITELQLLHFRIETTENTGKDAHLRYAHQKHPPHALWLPPESRDSPGQRLRIIATKSLKGCFTTTGSLPMPSPPPAPPRGSRSTGSGWR
jgi:hypothetical protein